MSQLISPAQIEQLRRNAKRVARANSISLSQALDRLAQASGFRNWSLLAKAAKTVEVAAAEARSGYLHGEPRDKDSGLFYCSMCHRFDNAAHFLEHDATENMARFQSEVAYRSHQLRHGRRLAQSNLFATASPARRPVQPVHGANRSDFYRWLMTQVARSGPIGDLARDVQADEAFPAMQTKLNKLRYYLHSQMACDGAIAALRDAYAEWRSHAALLPR